MLTFIPHKLKQLNYDVSIEGIDSSFLTANFTLVDKESGISYSVKGTINGNRINFTIPPLNSFILVVKDNYEAKLEITGNKYYLQPWQDSVNIFREPVATATIVDVPDSLEPDVTAIVTSRDAIDMEDIPAINPVATFAYEEKAKFPEKPQDEIKPHKMRQVDLEKKEMIKKIFEE